MVVLNLCIMCCLRRHLHLTFTRLVSPLSNKIGCVAIKVFFFTYFLQLKLDHFKFMMTLQLHTHGTNTKECKIRLLVRHRKDLVDR